MWNVYNHSDIFLRHPMLPQKFHEMWHGGKAAKDLLLKLRFCIEKDSIIYDTNPSSVSIDNNNNKLQYHGIIHDTKIKSMLHRHLNSSPPPLYDPV